MTALRYVLVSIAVCCGFISTFGQSQPPQLYPIPVHDKWGYIDRKGRVRIPLRFDSASEFREGLAVVELGGKYGFINSVGVFVVQPRLDDAFSFSEGLAAACSGDLCGFIDASSKFVIPRDTAQKWTIPAYEHFLKAWRLRT